MELKPRTRKEFLIADFIDKDTPDIVPKTRSEMFLKQMLDKISAGGSGSGGGGCLVITSDWASEGANGEASANMTFDEAYALLISGAPTVYRQNYGDHMTIYSNTDVNCYADRISVTVYAQSQWLLDVVFKADGSIEIPMDG